MCNRLSSGFCGGFWTRARVRYCRWIGKAKFGFTEVKIGFMPAIVVNFALRKLHEFDVRRKALTGDIVDAMEAMQIGIIAEIINDEVIESRVEKNVEGIRLRCEQRSSCAHERYFICSERHAV